MPSWGESWLDAIKFGLHSLRAGGTTVAANTGVADHLFKCHGWWQSELAKDGYVADSHVTRLSISKTLKLFVSENIFPHFLFGNVW